MGNFLRGRYAISNEPSFVQGAARILVAPSDATFPTKTGDFLTLASGATQFDPIAPWTEVGFTKTGINITRNSAEESYTVDQVEGPFKRNPNDWEMSLGTQLAEATLETFALAWELGFTKTGTGATGVLTPNITTTTGQTSPAKNEKSIGMGAPVSYIERKVLVMYQFPSGLIRTYAFRRAVRAAQEVGFTLNSTGEQVSLPFRMNCLPDPDQAIDFQFGTIFEQQAV